MGSERAIRQASVFERLEGRALMSGTVSLATLTVGQEGTYAPQVQLLATAQDANDNPDFGFNGDITVALVGTNPGTMIGTLTEQALQGTASFSDLRFSAAGDYQLIVTEQVDGNTESALFTTVTVPAANTTVPVVELTQPPTFDSSTGTFSVTAEVRDAQGDPIVVLPTNAKLGIASGPAGAELFGDDAHTVPPSTVTGVGGWVTGTVNTDGTITFSGLKVSEAGTYQFRLFASEPVGSILTASIDLPASTVPTELQPVTTPPAFTITPTPTFTVTPTSTATSSTPAAANQAVAPLTKAEKQAAVKSARLKAAQADKAAKAVAKAEKAAAHAALVAARKAGKQHSGISSDVA